MAKLLTVKKSVGNAAYIKVKNNIEIANFVFSIFDLSKMLMTTFTLQKNTAMSKSMVEEKMAVLCSESMVDGSRSCIPNIVAIIITRKSIILFKSMTI